MTRNGHPAAPAVVDPRTIGPGLSPGDASLAMYPRHGQRVRRRYQDQLHMLAPGLPVRATFEALCETLLQQGSDLAAALRIIRQLVIERLRKRGR